MSKVQTLRALVNERLAAAAEEISALFATAEYDEELYHSEEKNQGKQRLLGKALSRRVLLNQGLNQDFTEAAWIKEGPEEQSVTQEEEQRPMPVSESGAKTEESSELQQRQTEHQEETQEEDISSDPHFHSETEGHTDHSSNTDNDDGWEPPFSWSAAQMETEADGDNYNQVQSRDRSTKLSPNNKSAPEIPDHNNSRVQRRDRSTKLSPNNKSASGTTDHNYSRVQRRGRSTKLSSNNKSEPETTVHNDYKSGPDGTEKKHQCSICEKRFVRKQVLQVHIRVHTRERPYSCLTCNKAFSQQCNLIRHRRTHTGEKPYTCLTCNNKFSYKYQLKKHMSTHGGQCLELDGKLFEV